MPQTFPPHLSSPQPVVKSTRFVFRDPGSIVALPSIAVVTLAGDFSHLVPSFLIYITRYMNQYLLPGVIVRIKVMVCLQLSLAYSG